MPSASDAISRAMSGTVRPSCPGSRVLMNHAFSAKRQASRNSGTPNRSQRERTPRRFSSETGWPPPELFVTVTNTTGTSSARSTRSFSSASRSMFPLNGCSAAGSRPSAITRSTASAPVNSTFARVVSKCVLFGTTLPGPAIAREQDLLGGAPLMRRDHVREREQLLHGFEEHEPRGRPRVALVAVLDRRPLVAAHRARAGVGEQVDQDVVGVEVEQVVAGIADPRPALLVGEEPERLDGVDPERLDDRAVPVGHVAMIGLVAYRSICGATSCRPSIETARNSSSGRPISSSTSSTSSRLTPGANAFSLSFFFTLETFMPVAFSGRTSAAATSKPGDGVGVDDGPRHEVGPVLLVRVGEDAVDDALVDAGLAEPLGGEERVLRSVVARVVLVQIVEQAGEAPQLLVLVEPAREGSHHAFDRDQVTVGRLLLALLAREEVGF